MFEDIPNARGSRFVLSSTVGESVKAYLPAPLPLNPPLQLTNEHLGLLEKANHALGRLDGISALLPDTSLFIYIYVRKEAVLSSQIEGTRSSLSDLLRSEYEDLPGVPTTDIQEVSSYVNAMNYGLQRVRSNGFPISSHLLREIHEVLMSKGRGSKKNPGEFRQSQNWLGGTRPGNAEFVPPPYHHINELMSNLETFIHDDTPPLIKAALAHVQFETIHPFLDGNGRLGRLLITLLLCSEQVLTEPTLYLSLYFKTHRQRYYDLLQKVRFEGAWELWLSFFLEGVFETAQQAFRNAQSILELFSQDRKRIETLGRTAGSALQVHDYLRKRVYISIPEASQHLKLSSPTIMKAVQNLESLGILRETTQRERGRLWVYSHYLHLLNDGTDLTS